MNLRDIFNSFYPQDEDEKRENIKKNHERGKRQMDFKILCVVILIIYLLIKWQLPHLHHYFFD